MAGTMAQALAARIRYQAQAGEKVLQAAGEHSGEVFGNPAEVLSVRGNVSDVAVTNHLWLLDAVNSGALPGDLGALAARRPETMSEAGEFLAPRETDSAAEALERLRSVNEAIASRLEALSDSELEKAVDVTFYGDKTLVDVAFLMIEHGAQHLGQAWGILKGKGLA